MEPFRKFENFHIVLWLLKDLCWISDYKTLGMVMAVPTILIAIVITWLRRSVIEDLLHNLAVVCWICANAIWMAGEFFFQDTTRPYSLIFFIAGIVSVAIYYLVILPARKCKK
ncbi:MAG: hypothetical protein IPO27_10670 [Bacteroidetes bacterium]|nr:hypothetical protein [Bacteroidota bacterium]